MNPPINRIVRLDSEGDLVVDQIDLEREDEPQEIVWTLDTETLPNARFVSDKPKPHTWLRNTPWHAFSRAFPSDDGRSLSMEAMHRGSGTVGTFTYLLQVRLGGRGIPKVAKSKTADGIRAVSNPVIVNH